MSKFVMPAVDSAEYNALKARWSERPVSFGQCNMLKLAFKAVQNNGGWNGKVSKAIATRLAFLSQRDEQGRWTVLRTDSGELTMWDAHLLAETLNSISAGSPVTVAKGAPAPVVIPAESNWSEGDEFKIGELMALMDLSRNDAIDALVAKGKIVAPTISETIVRPGPGIYETVEGFRFQVKQVATRGNGTRLMATVL